MWRMNKPSREIPQWLCPLPYSCLSSHDRLNVQAFQRYFGKLPREETLAVCAKLNILFGHAQSRSVDGYQERVIRLLAHHQWLDTADVARFERYVGRRAGGFDENPFFMRNNCLEMMRWLAVWGLDSEAVGANNIGRKQAFARAMLMAFEFWTERNQRRILTSEKYEAGENEQRQFECLRVMRESHIWQYPTFNCMWQLGRAQELYLDAFFEQNPALKAKIEEQLGMAIEDYFTCNVGISSLIEGWFGNTGVGIVDNFEFNPHHVASTTPHMKAVMQQFLALEGQSPSELRAAYQKLMDRPLELTDLRPLRNKPILIFNSGQRAVILDEPFLSERTSTGILFRASSIVGSQAMIDFGNAFQTYASKRLDRYVDALRKRGLSVSGYSKVTVGSNNAEFTDYVMICGKTLLLIEMKGRWLNDSAVGSLSAEDYWKEICEKYVLDTSKKTHRRKGVSQLAWSIEGWLNKERVPNISFDVREIDTIIPILLVSDRHLPAMFHGTFLAKEFQSRLPNVPAELQPVLHIDGHRILNLCLISMDEFEHFENRVLQRTLADLIEEYAKKYPYREASAGTFLAHIGSEPFAPQPGIVAESEAVLDKACISLFGRSLL